MAFWDTVTDALGLTKATTTSTTSTTSKTEKKPVDVTVPLGSKPSKSTDVKLNSYGNVPISQKPSEDQSMTGLKIETASSSKKPSTTGSVDTSGKKQDKPTESMDDFFNRYYTKYRNADEAGKLAFIKRYLTSMANNPKTNRLHLTYLEKGVSEEEIYKLGYSIGYLCEENQLKAATDLATKGTEEQNRLGARALGRSFQTYAQSVRLGTFKVVTESNDDEAVKTASSSMTALAKGERVAATKMVEESKISDTAKQETDKIIIDQTSKFAPDEQLGIHEIMSASKFSSTVEYSAANIINLNKSVQADAVKVTLATNNEKAINITAANILKYDESVQPAVKTIIQSSEYDAAKQIVVDTIDKAEMEKSSSPLVSSTQVTTASNNTSDKQDDLQTVKSYSVSNKVEEVKAILENKDNTTSLVQTISTCTDAEKIALLNDCPSSEVINAIMQTNPSLSVLSNIDNDYIKAVGYKRLVAQICFLNADAQIAIVRDAADAGNLSDIRREFLKPQVKDIFDKCLLEIKKKNAPAV